MNDEIKRKMKKREANPTLKLIGDNGLDDFFPAKNDLDNLISFYHEENVGEILTHSDLVSIIFDSYMLGTIYGKKIERSRKNKKELTPLTYDDQTIEDTLQKLALLSSLSAEDIQAIIDKAKDKE